jgi:pimeloyl-ACP methyl ester carboxylesterase
MALLTHRFINTNGILMHIAQQGSGPLVILCHGFLESWYSWRHQLTALSEAGYHVLAPDQRGYGQADRPEPIEAYNILELTVANLKKKVLLPGAGHWIQQERPTEVNQLLIEFLASLNI